MHWLDITLLIMLGIGAVLGFWSGLLWQVARVVSLGLSLYCAFTANNQATDWLVREWKDASPVFCRLVAFVAVFLTVYIAFYLVTRLLHQIIKSTKLEFADRILGALLGTAKMAAILCAVCAGLVALALPMTEEWLQHSILAPQLARGMDTLFTMVPPEYRDRIDENVHQARDQLQKKMSEAAVHAFKDAAAK